MESSIVRTSPVSWRNATENSADTSPLIVSAGRRGFRYRNTEAVLAQLKGDWKRDQGLDKFLRRARSRLHGLGRAPCVPRPQFPQLYVALLSSLSSLYIFCHSSFFFFIFFRLMNRTVLRNDQTSDGCPHTSPSLDSSLPTFTHTSLFIVLQCIPTAPASIFLFSLKLSAKRAVNFSPRTLVLSQL